MKDHSAQFLEFLTQAEFISAEKLEDAQATAKKKGKTLEDVLVEREWLRDDQVGQIVADIHKWSFINLRKEAIDKKVLNLIPESVAQKQGVIAFAKTDKGMKVAMTNPDDTTLLHLLKKRAPNQKLIVYYATPRDIKMALNLYQKEIGGKFEKLLKAQEKEVIGGKAKDSAVVQIVDLLLWHGYENKASDIHIEPQEENSTVRFRIDGVLHDIVEIPKEIHDLITTRVKIMAKLRTDEHQTPQDGKIQHTLEGEKVDIRVSVVPTTKGENIVMRLLSEKARQFSLEDLGFSEKDFAKLSEAIKKPWGMILATGPTGSGKTTTLYAILKILNKRVVNVATIEDPVEYNMPGITQIQVNNKADLTFASGLRSIVRQDPDIIMVGEIRDSETAEIAVNSAMTGHLVLSTLHTNDAPTTMPRISDMGIEPFLISSTVNIVIGQRLVRKICPKCIHTHETDLADLQNKIPISILEKLARGREKIMLYKGKGCDVCQHTGYAGRVGIFELMEMSDDIRALIMQGANAETIKQKAVAEGMVTMLDDAIEKILNGITTVDELMRTIKY